MGGALQVLYCIVLNCIALLPVFRHNQRADCRRRGTWSVDTEDRRIRDGRRQRSRSSYCRRLKREFMRLLHLTPGPGGLLTVGRIQKICRGSTVDVGDTGLRGCQSKGFVPVNLWAQSELSV